ncbi:MAG: glycosyltransferase family 2 protein [candidate division Zixibacteria bacterium]|nr:glycosyltransferase family 2 protein [candidate division Zixibacteria bacterium]
MDVAIIFHILFWLAGFMIFWTYFGYLIALKLIVSVRARKVNKEDITPPISIIITAYNEEMRIAKKLDNTLNINYPVDKTEIIVVSDGSTDKTDDIVKSYSDRGVKLLRIEGRNGKHYGQGQGIRFASNDIVILSDATTFLESRGIRNIVSNFADPEVGCVSSEDRMQSIGSSESGEGAYVRYEMKLRALESAVGSLVGVSGSFFAARKELTEGWIDNMSADFFMPLLTYKAKMRTVTEPDAVGYYEVVHEPGKEFTRKVRTVVHGLEVLFKFKELLNPFKYGLYSFKIFSHKLSRWLVPFYLFCVLAANIFLLSSHMVYWAALAGQILLYLLALTAFIVPRLNDITFFRIPFFFVMVNWSIVVSWYYFIIGKDFVVWEPTKR